MMQTENDSAVLFYACSLCLRLYTLKEDLRGHMIEYHKWLPIETASCISNRPKTKQILVLEANNQSTKISKGITTQDQLRNIKKNEETTELRPMPFKNFRFLLRSKFTLRCTASAACGYKFENSQKEELHTKCHVNDSKCMRAHSGAHSVHTDGDIQSSASNLGDFKCFKCEEKCANWRQCSAHLWKNHQIDVDLLQCPICNAFKAQTTVHVWRHMRVHKKWRPIVLRTLRAVQKRRHQKDSQSNGSTTTTTTNIPPLSTTLLNKNKYYAEKTCEICNRKFVNGKTLSKHVKTVHNKIKPFICNICGMKTARKASLVIHMRQHTGEKPLECKSCKFSTRDPSVLKKHQKRHNRSGLFNCNFCNYACIQTISLKRHMRLKHPEEFQKISCDLCSFVTTNNVTLTMHKEDHRRGLILNADDSMDASSSSRCDMKVPRKLHDKNEMSADCFLPLESIDSLPHDPPVDTGGVTIPAPPSEDTQFPTYLSN